MNKDFFKLGIIGNPLLHSISPLIHQLALQNTNLRGSYEKFEVTKEGLSKIIEFFKSNDFTGFNVTIPHKVNIIQYLDEIDEYAKKIGAVNTVKVADGRLIGYNTDVYGFANSLVNRKKDIKKAKMLGCGGAALAVVFGLEHLGCEEITICARNKDKMQDFINIISSKTNMIIHSEFLQEMTSLTDTDILINATPLGTFGENESKMAIDKDILHTANKHILIYDLVYNPAKTQLVKESEKLNLTSINGLDMLILQAVKAFEIWTDKSPNIQYLKDNIRY